MVLEPCASPEPPLRRQQHKRLTRSAQNLTGFWQGECALVGDVLVPAVAASAPAELRALDDRRHLPRVDVRAKQLRQPGEQPRVGEGREEGATV